MGQKCMQITPNQYQMLLCNHEIWPKFHLAHTKSDYIGFRISSDAPVAYKT